MQIRELAGPDAYEITPRQFPDDRGVFLEWYRFDRLADVIGHPLDLRQANTSVSKRGVVRGIHYADLPPGQAKYVTSPTFGQWDSVLLDTVDRRAIYLAEGLGHAFVALTPDATVSYLVSDVYNPAAEHAIDPLDAEVGLVFPPEAGELLLSPKDTDAPGLAEARDAGSLPDWTAARGLYDALAVG